MNQIEWTPELAIEFGRLCAWIRKRARYLRERELQQQNQITKKDDEKKEPAGL